MEVTYDEAKREKTLQERGLDFADAKKIFTSFHISQKDDRQNYGETRYITYGILNDRIVVVVWTDRIKIRRIISLRKANDREQAKVRKALGRSR